MGLNVNKHNGPYGPNIYFGGGRLLNGLKETSLRKLMSFEYKLKEVEGVCL